MYAGFLYRLNYEDYRKREQELDEKIKQLALENDDEDITPVDEAYIIRIGGEKNIGKRALSPFSWGSTL